jgi:hypothetical protein
LRLRLQQHGAERADDDDRKRGRLDQRGKPAAVERVSDEDPGQRQRQTELAGQVNDRSRR